MSRNFKKSSTSSMEMWFFSSTGRMCPRRQRFIWTLPEWWKFIKYLLFNILIISQYCPLWKTEIWEKEDFMPFLHETLVRGIFKQTNKRCRGKYLNIGSAQSQGCFFRQRLAKKSKPWTAATIVVCEKEDGWKKLMQKFEEIAAKNWRNCCMRKNVLLLFSSSRLVLSIIVNYSTLFPSQLTRLFSNVIIFE